MTSKHPPIDGLEENELDIETQLTGDGGVTKAGLEQHVVAAASEWWLERAINDWSEADLAKAVTQLLGDWPGCEGCDHAECDEPCKPATVAEQLHAIDCRIAQLVFEGKLAKPIDYTPPAGWRPTEFRRRDDALIEKQYRWTFQLLQMARRDSDAVSTFCAGTKMEDTQEAIFVVKGNDKVRRVMDVLTGLGLLSSNPVNPVGAPK